MAGVVDLRPVDGDGHQPSVDFNLAVLAHGAFLMIAMNAGLPQVALLQNAALADRCKMVTSNGQGRSAKSFSNPPSVRSA
jgi:hypothetical protein